MRLLSVIALLATAAPFLLGQGIGEPVAAWTPGTLDIHHIQTGRGNAAFVVFPDGTTLLLDAGAVPDREGLELGPRRPNPMRSTAQWIAQYIRQFGPKHAAALDYAVVTHYHDDHMGALAELAQLVHIDTLIDRGDSPKPPPYTVVDSYFAFRRAFAGQVQALRAGKADQIVPRRGGVANFEVRNVASNGVVWSGSRDEAVSQFPANWQSLAEGLQPKENDFSNALAIRYGGFRYFTGGDLAGVPLDELPAWHDLETPIARAVGPVDVLVLNHHGWLDTTNPYFLKILNPRVVVIPAWHASHPDHSVLRRLRSPGWRPAPPDLFTTSLLPATRAIVSYMGRAFQSTEGHILIRVAVDGASYRVMVLDDESEAAKLKGVWGPYQSQSPKLAE